MQWFTISDVNGLTRVIKNIDSKDTFLRLDIQSGSSLGEPHRNDTEAFPGEIASCPQVETLNIKVIGERSDFIACDLSALLKALHVLSGVNHLSLVIGANGPSFNGLPAFPELQSITLETRGHPLDGLPVFPKLNKISFLNGCYSKEAEQELLRISPHIWLDDMFYNHACDDNGVRDYAAGIKSVLRRWPEDEALPIAITDIDNNELLAYYTIPKRMVSWLSEDERYSMVEGRCSFTIRSDAEQYKTRGISYLNLKKDSVKRLIVYKNAILLEYELWQKDINSGCPVIANGSAYLPLSSYSSCCNAGKRYDIADKDFLFIFVCEQWEYGIRREETVSEIAGLAKVLEELEDNVNRLILNIKSRGADIEQNLSGSCQYSGEMPARPKIKKLLLDIKGSREDFNPDDLAEMLGKLASINSITELQLYIQPYGPSLNGLPIFPEITDLVLATWGHPLDGLPLFPKLKPQDITSHNGCYSEEAERAILTAYPCLWLDPSIYYNSDCPFTGVKSVLKRWPEDKKLPISIEDNEDNVYFSISKDRVLFQNDDSPYPFKRSDYDVVIWPYRKPDYPHDIDLWEGYNFLDLNQFYFEKLIVDKSGIFLEFSIMKYQKYWDWPTEDGFAYLPIEHYYYCYTAENYMGRYSDKRQRFVFFMP